MEFACAYSSVNVLEKVGFLAFLQSFLHKIYNESSTDVEHAGQVRGHFALARECVKEVLPAACSSRGFRLHLWMASRCGHPEGPLPPRMLEANSLRLR